jgi:hypothetical protein
MSKEHQSSLNKDRKQLIDAEDLKMKRGALILAVLVLSASPSYASIAHVYVAQTQAGMANGSSCSNAFAVTFLAASMNWGTGAAQIGPDTTVHLCGTFSIAANTEILIAQGSGTSGHPVTILFESGAVLTEPYGPNIYTKGMIDLNGFNYITVDGNGANWPGANAGTITTSANGTSLANHNGTYAINLQSCTGCIVQHMNIINLYVRTGTAGASEVACGNACVVAVASSSGAVNPIVRYNTIHDLEWALLMEGDNVDIGPGNEIYNADHSVVTGATHWFVHDNHFHDWQIWDSVDNTWHHDGVHCFSGATGGTQVGFVYNNLMDGDLGANATGFVFEEGYTSGNTPCYVDGGHSVTYNNVFINLYRLPTFLVWLRGNIGSLGTGSNSGDLFYNNTMIGNSLTSGDLLDIESVTGLVMENNAYGITGDYYDGLSSGSWGTVNYNAYEGCQVYPAASNCFPTIPYYNLAHWQALGYDANSTQNNFASTTYFNITATGSLNSGSPLITHGLNLYSVGNGQPTPGLGPLIFDKAGNARPASGAWDIGAFQSTSATPFVTLTPASLSFGNQIVGTSSAIQNVTLKNTGSANLTITSVVASSDYSVVTTPATNCGGTMAPASTCNLAVTFSPAKLGSDPGTITISDDAVGSPHTVTLTGTGLSAPNITLVNFTACPSRLLSGSCTIASTTAGNELVAGITFNNGSGGCVVSSITGGGTWASGGARSVNATPNSSAEIWAVPNVAGATTIVNINATPTTGCSAEAVFWEAKNINTRDVAAAANNIASSATPSGAAITTTHGTEFIVGILNYQGSISSIFSGNIFTNSSTIQGNGWAYYIQTAIGTRAPRWQGGAAGTSNGSTAGYYFK